MRREPSRNGDTPYDITGPAALIHAEMAQQLSKVVGKQITYVDLSPGAMREALLRYGMPAWQADGLVEDYDHYRLGEASAVSSTVRDLTGKDATSFSQFAKDYANSFLGRARGTA